MRRDVPVRTTAPRNTGSDHTLSLSERKFLYLAGRPVTVIDVIFFEKKPRSTVYVNSGFTSTSALPFCSRAIASTVFFTLLMPPRLTSAGTGLSVTVTRWSATSRSATVAVYVEASKPAVFAVLVVVMHEANSADTDVSAIIDFMFFITR